LVVAVAVAGATVLTAVALGTQWTAAEPPDEPPAGPVPDCSYYVSTEGSDRAPGSSDQPWRTIHASLSKLSAGDTLCVRSGTYDEEVAAATPPQGTAASRIALRGVSEDGEPPVIRGGFSLVGPDKWTISGLRFTNPSPANDDDRVVSILGGAGWIFENNEVFDGPYAGLLVAASQTNGAPRDYIIRANVIHHTKATNLYLNPSRFSTGGLVERNVFFDSGTENVKLGWGGDRGCSGDNFSDFGIGGVTFRYNTLHNANRGALYIAEPGGLHRVDVYGNLLTGQPRYLVRYDSVEGCLGDRVNVHNNAGGLAPKFSEDFGDSPKSVDREHGNVFSIDPEYDSTDPDGFLPGNRRVQAFGRYASG
jgi:hypothetical protein